jgi:lipooligosaccharide transport system ATP-binding protein
VGSTQVREWSEALDTGLESAYSEKIVGQREQKSSLVVEARAVVKHFGSRAAVNGLDLEVAAGLCFGVLGPNGAGKTTTLRMIYGVTRPTGGTIRIFGIDITRDPRAVRARVGVTLQQNVLIEALSVEENLRVFGRYHLLREPELSRRVKDLIQFLDLGSHAGMAVRYLSGGLQRRLAVAQSLMNGPQLLILDEPTTGLDPAVRLALWSRIRELRAAGTTVLLTTHYMDEAERLCDAVAIISEGRIVAQGAPRALIESRLAAAAVEFDCAPEEEAVLLDGVSPVRRMRVGRRLMIYLDDAAPLISHIHLQDQGDRRGLIVRPTNLEDVFLALTGTRLEAGV